MADPPRKLYYFISVDDRCQSFNQTWYLRLPSRETIILPDRLYKTTDYIQVNSDVNFIVHAGTIEKELKHKKSYSLVQLTDDIRFYFDQSHGFIEADEDQEELVINLFDRLLSIDTSRKTIILFSG